MAGSVGCQQADGNVEKKIRPMTLRVALLTPAGRGALAVVGVAGTHALETVARLFSPRGRCPLASRTEGGIVVGRWGDSERGEELVVVRRSADSLEVHCHGGLAASEAVLASLEAVGAVRQPWAEFLSADGMGEIAVEARKALAQSAGPKAARILCRQLVGCLQAEFDRIEFMLREGEQATAHVIVQRLRRVSRVGLRLTRPWRVVLVGPVNSGKSSLVNALAGYARCIVSAQPGTTRDLLETRIVLGGWEIDLIDTAGLRPACDDGDVSPTERAGIDRAIAAAAKADLVVEIQDSHSQKPTSQERDQGVKAMCVVTKADLSPRVPPAPADPIRTSAVTGEGIDMLAASIVRSLVPEEAEDPSFLAAAVPFTQRHARLLDTFAHRLQ